MFNVKTAQEIHIKAMTEQMRRAITNAIMEVPNGVIEMHSDVDGLTKTSSNLGVIKTSEDKIELGFAARSAEECDMDLITKTIEGKLEKHGFETNRTIKVSPWKIDADSSQAVKIMNKAYKNVTGEDAKLSGVHGGLEVATISETLGNALKQSIDAVSIGPDIKNSHSPDEYVDIESVEVLYKQLKEALRLIAEGGMQKGNG